MLLQSQAVALDIYGRGILVAADATSPSSARQPTDMLTNRRLATRSCSQLISTLKVVSGLPPGWPTDMSAVKWGLALVCGATEAGPGVTEVSAGECTKCFKAAGDTTWGRLQLNVVFNSGSRPWSMSSGPRPCASPWCCMDGVQQGCR
jgi:hypothetical protein